MKVEYLGVNALNSDSGICDAARVSFDARAENFSEEKNEKLIRYLHAHNHWSPFGHAREAFILRMSGGAWLRFFSKSNLTGFSWESELDCYSARVLNGSLWAWWQNLKFLPTNIREGIGANLQKKYPLCKFLKEPVETKGDWIGVEEPAFLDARLDDCGVQTTYVSFRIKAPLFVARQLVKHQRHLCWNEESRRYISGEPSFWKPDVWRARPENKKQGSTGVIDQQLAASEEFRQSTLDAQLAYVSLLNLDVAPEMARSVLPLASNTSWMWTGSIDAFSRVVAERTAPDAQAETAEIGSLIKHYLQTDLLTKNVFLSRISQ